ncbi:DNA cytosine methyltransferase [Longimicrobium terrae]|uniref:Cytosine-specific methyltransferase n=1 Tax=Longimicrobium terrae TaxID=1639882 RepID=A0A841GXJ7_9BACT|nr:DNA cytosine methyltransferase [Longimicrobium terrae]MBB4636086.1 DNA (cytosine-5)-methyltransferase 1 [Longimicrobium terrae]MBB6070481.1 DNA (cytosine-5)-methyltransferase 1 [Longimicrobium terrae]NNC29472.1 DNA cytosine methyltransferase [Longimicrobium terrae]
MLTSLEICAGAGGQALGIEQAGFNHVACVEVDPFAAATLRKNRPGWNPLEMDVRDLRARDYRGVDLFAGGVPCPPFSIAGKQLGAEDERDLFPTALRLIEKARPKAVMLENVKGLSGSRFSDYRRDVVARLERMGYRVDWRVLNACNYGVPQLRPRFILIALRPRAFARFAWPEPVGVPPTVGSTLRSAMAAREWAGANAWAEVASGIAPTLVGGSKKHGGPDLGPTRAKAAWRAMRVDAMGLADLPPGPDFPIDGAPKLTVSMAAEIQGFPREWEFAGRKTAAYRQVGNAFPPPVAEAVATSIRDALTGKGTARARPRKSEVLTLDV